MATPRYKGQVSADIREQTREDLDGFDTITREIRVRRTHLDVVFRLYAPGVKHPTEPGMVVKSREKNDGGNYGEITVLYWGAMTNKVPPFVSETRPRLLQQVSLSDEAGQSVSVSYFSESYQVTWMHRGAQEPRGPRFRSKAPSGLSPKFSNPDPPSYTGNLAYKTRVKLQEFTPQWIAPGVWSVSETWSRLVQPVTDPTNASASQGNDAGGSEGDASGE